MLRPMRLPRRAAFRATALALFGGVLQPAKRCVGAIAPPDPPKGADLIGTWRVDLRPTPNAPSYYKEFVVKNVDGTTFSGTFYGSDFENGRLNTDWGVVHFAFVTTDASGAYNHSGTLRDGKLQGLSHSLGRKFLSVWTWERA